MRGPRVYVVQGWNYNEGNLLAWYFDEIEANERRDEINRYHGDEYAVRVESCEAGKPMQEGWCRW